MLDDTYINSETPMNYICTCGNKSKMSYKNAKKGRNCAECGLKNQASKKVKFTIAFIRKYFEDNGCTLLSEEYTNSRRSPQKLRYICKCGHTSEIQWFQAYHSGTNCSNCRTLRSIESRLKYTVDEISEMFAAQGKELLEEEFKNSLTPMKYVCKCGRISRITLNNFLKGKDCVKCGAEKISETRKDPSITDEERVLRRSLREDKRWRVAVYLRDDYTCQCCRTRGAKLNAHHIFNFVDNPDNRRDVDN